MTLKVISNTGQLSSANISKIFTYETNHDDRLLVLSYFYRGVRTDHMYFSRSLYFCGYVSC